MIYVLVVYKIEKYPPGQSNLWLSFPFRVETSLAELIQPHPRRVGLPDLRHCGAVQLAELVRNSTLKTFLSLSSCGRMYLTNLGSVALSSTSL